jgi:hypothetical protein
MCQARPGAVDGIAAATDRGIEPAVNVEEQVLEAALGHQYLDAHWKCIVVGPLLWRAPPVHDASLAARMFMICSGAPRLEQALSHQEPVQVC